MTDHSQHSKNVIQNSYWHALELTREIYLESQYGVNDLYRIEDIVNSLGKVQFDSKTWLVEQAAEVLKDHGGRIYVAGGWYGLCAALLWHRFPRPKCYVISADIDPMAEVYGHKIFKGADFGFVTEDAFVKPEQNLLAWVSTSTEHVDPEVLYTCLSHKSKDTWVIAQNNDYYDHASHINCYPTVEEFAKSLPLKHIAYKGEMSVGSFNRFMVIGK